LRRAAFAPSEVGLDNPIGWYASLSGIVAALIIAADIDRRITAWAFTLFTTSSIAWIVAGLIGKEDALLWQNIILLCVNVLGAYQRFKRKKS
jgi:hypothetical protein